MSAIQSARLRDTDLTNLTPFELLDLYEDLDNLAYLMFDDQRICDRCHVVFAPELDVVSRHLLARPPGVDALVAKAWIFLHPDRRCDALIEAVRMDAINLYFARNKP